jgi:AmmeMemoRadiSam system protein A
VVIPRDAQGVALDLAVRAVREPLVRGRRWLPRVADLPASLSEPGAAFVTLTRGPAGPLMGCIGSLTPRDPLGVDIARNAAAAAFDDPRMPAVVLADLEQLYVEVSVLSAPARLDVTGWTHLQALVRPGLDGVLVESPDGRRATLLPSVWASLPDPAGFLAALWRKARFRPGEWPSGIVVSRYETLAFGAAARDHRAEAPL